MADHGGDGNIKVVVRCRPLNSRGPSHPTSSSRPSQNFVLTSDFSICSEFRTMDEQNSPEARNPSSACQATKPSSTHPRQAPNKTNRARRSARRCRSASTSRIGVRGLGTSRGIARSRRCSMISGRSCWTMGLRGLIRVSWPVRVFPFL